MDGKDYGKTAAPVIISDCTGKRFSERELRQVFDKAIISESPDPGPTHAACAVVIGNISLRCASSIEPSAVLVRSASVNESQRSKSPNIPSFLFLASPVVRQCRRVCPTTPDGC
jgi:hypothetical protein